MMRPECRCCGATADKHHPEYPDGTGWFCTDCWPKRSTLGHADFGDPGGRGVRAMPVNDVGVFSPSAARRRLREALP
jgi:hypothetical protein